MIRLRLILAGFALIAGVGLAAAQERSGPGPAEQRATPGPGSVVVPNFWDPRARLERPSPA
jgi:hypothetical protein